MVTLLLPLLRMTLTRMVMMPPNWPEPIMRILDPVPTVRDPVVVIIPNFWTPKMRVVRVNVIPPTIPSVRVVDKSVVMATNCMCGNNRCIEGDESSHSHDGSASSSSDDSHTHGHDATELAGTHYEDTRPCADCKRSCGGDNPEFLDTEDAGCKSQCHTAYDPFCTCGGQICGDGFEGAEGPYTVFLPTDAAFAELDSAVGGLANVDTDVLCGILEFHVVAEKALSSSDLSCETGDGSLIGMANGVNSRVKCTKDVPYGIKGGGNDKPANFVDVDIQASDGYVHTIDNVLFYPAVLDSPFGQTTGGENIVPSFRGAVIP